MTALALRASDAKLYEHALSLLPVAGQSILYTEWDAKVRASDYPDAVHMYRLLKKDGKIKASLTVQPDGSIKHEITRGA